MGTARSDDLCLVARRVEQALPPSVTDVVLTGSTSRGVADELSDIELLVVGDDLLACPPLDGVQTWASPAPTRWFGGSFDGEHVELVCWTSAFVEERVASIAAGAILDHARLRAAEAIVNGIPLRGDGHARWRERLAVYPEGLADRIVADAATAWTETVQSERGLQRPGDALMLAWRYVDGAEHLLRIVYALNRAWPPGWKRLAERLDALAVKPERMAARIDAIGRTLDLQALRDLADETLALAPELPVVVAARRALVERL